MQLSNISFLGLIPLALAGCAGTRPESPPNIIYVFPDQMRNSAMGFWDETGFKENVNFLADPVHTPHLNAFAKESLVLTSAVSNFPLSSPYRGMLLTGMFPDGSGVPLNCNSNRPVSSLREDAVCVSDVLKKAGYDCGYIGKFHLDFPIPNDPQNPGHYVESRMPVWNAYTPPEKRHGFNFWYSYGTYNGHKNPHYWDTEGNKHDIREWSPKHEADKAISYLRNENNVRDTGKPFFLVISMNPPHNPYNSLNDCMEEDYDLYRDIPVSKLLIRPNADTSMKKVASAPYYFASVTGVDREFGRILKELERQGLDKNTIVIFTSDHGETMCSHGVTEPKNSPYRESMNVPFIIRYPDRIAPRTDDLLLSTPDIMPTLLGLCGLEKQIPREVAGTNHSDIFSGKNGNRPEAALYMKNSDGDKDHEGKIISYFPSARGIKTHRYTLSFNINTKKQLVSSMFFDDQNDPYQLVNLPLEHNKELVLSLCREMATLLKKADDPWHKEKILNDLIPYE